MRLDTDDPNRNLVKRLLENTIMVSSIIVPKRPGNTFPK